MKLIKCLISLFIFSALLIIMPAFARTTTPQSVVQLDKTQKIVKVTAVKHAATSRIANVYPKLLVAGSSVNAFNEKVKATLNSLTTAFLKDANNQARSSLTTRYTLYRSMLNQHPVISVLLESESSITGFAHPSHPLASLTYDLKQGKVLSLGDLFKPGSDYLTVISNYTRQALLSRKDADQIKDFITAGTKPTLDHFKVWNLTDKGLLITFPEYAVAPYYYGKQSVLIPFSVLKDIM